MLYFLYLQGLMHLVFIIVMIIYHDYRDNQDLRQELFTYSCANSSPWQGHFLDFPVWSSQKDWTQLDNIEHNKTKSETKVGKIERRLDTIRQNWATQQITAVIWGSGPTSLDCAIAIFKFARFHSPSELRDSLNISSSELVENFLVLPEQL